MRRPYVILLVGLLVLATAGARPIAGWVGSGGQAASVVQADSQALSTPTPSLGSTPQTGANPPGDADGDPDDFDRAPWVVGGFILLVVLIGGALLISRQRRQRSPRE